MCGAPSHVPEAAMQSSQPNANLVDEAEWPLETPDFPGMEQTAFRAVDIVTRLQRAYREADMAIHVDDEMWNGLVMHPETDRRYARLHYSYGGRSALRSIGNALIAAQLPSPRRVLDFPSSHGRVTRYLVKAFPEAEV